MKINLPACVLAIVLTTTTMAQTRSIVADVNKTKGNKSIVFNECIGAGRANEGLRADWQQQLATAKKDIGFRYIRFHGLLHDDMRVYAVGKDGKTVYNWQYIDRLFDYLLSIRIKPFVEFGFMPADLASGTKTIFWWKANVSKPKSYPEWDNLIKELVTHWKTRYGLAEIRTWYFEVWNEPDLRGFFDGTQDDYFELYAHTAKAVKSVSEQLRVGGPATSATRWIPEFLTYCSTNKLPVDFVSTHDYGTTSVLDEFGTKKQGLKPNQDSIAFTAKRIRGEVQKSAYKNAELHYTEWNSSPSSRDPIHDTYQNAAFILNSLKNIGTTANSMSYWTFTDIFEEAGPGQTSFHGGFGLMNLQDIKKPTYYTYKFLNELGANELTNSDSKSIICKSDNGIQALFWDYTHPNASMGYKYDQEFFPVEQPSKDPKKVSLSIKNVPNGKYIVEVYRIGYLNNDPYTAYIRMGKPAQISLSQEKELKSLSSGKPINTSTITITNGAYNSAFELRSNDIWFVKLRKL